MFHGYGFLCQMHSMRSLTLVAGVALQDVVEAHHRERARAFMDPAILRELWSTTNAHLQRQQPSSTPLVPGTASTTSLAETGSSTGRPGTGVSAARIAPRTDERLEALCSDPDAKKHVAVAEKGQVRRTWLLGKLLLRGSYPEQGCQEKSCREWLASL
jgi:hypothetical protein